MPKGVTLRKEQITYNSPYRLRVTAEPVGDGDANIFVYLKRTDDPNSPSTDARFDHVAVPSDLEEVPVGLPLVGASELFFRLNTVDILVRDVDELKDIWNTLKSHTALLVESLAQIQTLTETAEVAVSF
jgi:hypothetical protein